jgi:hypothetical protein
VILDEYDITFILFFPLVHSVHIFTLFLFTIFILYTILFLLCEQTLLKRAPRRFHRHTPTIVRNSLRLLFDVIAFEYFPTISIPLGTRQTTLVVSSQHLLLFFPFLLFLDFIYLFYSCTVLY